MKNPVNAGGRFSFQIRPKKWAPIELHAFLERDGPRVDRDLVVRNSAIDSRAGFDLARAGDAPGNQKHFFGKQFTILPTAMVMTRSAS